MMATNDCSCSTEYYGIKERHSGKSASYGSGEPATVTTVYNRLVSFDECAEHIDPLLHAVHLSHYQIVERCNLKPIRTVIKIKVKTGAQWRNFKTMKKRNRRKRL